MTQSGISVPSLKFFWLHSGVENIFRTITVRFEQCIMNGVAENIAKSSLFHQKIWPPKAIYPQSWPNSQSFDLFSIFPGYLVMLRTLLDLFRRGVKYNQRFVMVEISHRFNLPPPKITHERVTPRKPITHYPVLLPVRKLQKEHIHLPASYS